MFGKIFWSAVIIFIMFKSMPKLLKVTSNTTNAIENLGFAIKNDTVAMLYNHSIFLNIRNYILDADKKMMEIYQLLLDKQNHGEL